MANPNLTRVHQKIFAGNAVTDEIGVFGSLQAGTKLTSSNIATLQSLAAYGLGFGDAATSGEQLPSLEEVNGLHKTETEQIQYILNKGIPEWTTEAEYYIGDIQREVGGRKLYRSITDNNIGNALTDTLNWEIYYDPDNSTFDNVTINNKLNAQPNAATISGGAVTYTGAYMVIDTEGGAATDDLDTINGGSDGDILILKQTDSARDINIVGNGSGNILLRYNDTVTLNFNSVDAIILIYNGTAWCEASRSLHNDFQFSASTSGYTYLPNGLIIQWGTNSIAASTNLAITLPITYTTAHLFSAACFTSANLDIGDSPITQRTSTSVITVGNGHSNAEDMSWWSIGY